MFDVFIRTGGSTVLVTAKEGVPLATATAVAQERARTRKGVFIKNRETGAIQQVS